MIKHLEKENLTDLIGDGITIIDFFAQWCGPCKMLSPILEELEENVIKIDVDAHPDLATEYGVMSIPTLYFFKDGQPVHREIGFKSKEDIEKIIKELK